MFSCLEGCLPWLRAKPAYHKISAQNAPNQKAPCRLLCLEELPPASRVDYVIRLCARPGDINWMSAARSDLWKLAKELEASGELEEYRDILTYARLNLRERLNKYYREHGSFC